MKKIAVFLLAAMLLSSVTACGAQTEDTADTADETTENETASKEVFPDYDGRSFTIALSTESERDIAADTLTGEITNDAIYERNRKIEENYHILLQHNIISDDLYKWYPQLTTLVLAGDDTYDLAGHYAYQLYQAVSADIFLDWNCVEGIDLSADWWATSINESATFHGKLFGLSGYLGMSMMQYAEAMFFNTRLCADQGITDQQLYQLVYDGKWTFDTFAALSRDIYVDLNGNNERDDDDLYGYASCTGNSFDLWQTAFDLPVTGKDENGELTEYVLTEKRVKAIEVLAEYLHNNARTKVLTANSAQTDWLWYEQYNFSRERQAFMAGIFLAAYEIYRDMSDEYAIVPIPKWEEAQSEYLTHLNDRYTIWGIPATVTDTEFVGTITDALARESYETVYPAFYDVALKQKFSKDTDCAAMVDIVMSGLRFDVAYMFGEYMVNAPYIFRNLVKSNSTDLASTYEASKNQLHEKMKEVIGFYAD